MREIKFRMWDDIDKRMVSWEEIDVLDQEGIYPFLQMFKDRKILMQYTGLKDKNGREIYEGDIIKGLFYEPLSKTYKTTICYVVWDISGYWTYKGERDFRGGYLTDIKDVEVIGNVYENPELIAT